MALQLYHDIYKSESTQEHPPELVLIHGWGMHSLVWDDVMPGLLKHFTVRIIDLPGFGRSPVAKGDYDLDYLVTQVMAVAPEKALWMGWSLGGMIALRIAEQFPERVTALINVASTPRFIQGEAWKNAVPEKVLKGFYSYLLEDWEGTLIRFLALQCKDSESQKDDTRKLRELVYFHGLPATQALRGGLEVLQNVDLREALQQLTIPTLYLFGEKDNLIPANVAGDIKDLNNNVEVAHIMGSSHVPFMTAPDLFLQALNDFFQTKEFDNDLGLDLSVSE